MERAELIAWLGKSKTAARRTVSGHLSALQISTRFSDRWMESLVQYHANKSYLVTSVVFVICTRPPYLIGASSVTYNQHFTSFLSPFECDQSLGAFSQWPDVPVLLVLDSFPPLRRVQLLQQASMHGLGT